MPDPVPMHVATYSDRAAPSRFRCLPLRPARLIAYVILIVCWLPILGIACAALPKLPSIFSEPAMVVAGINSLKVGVAATLLSTAVGGLAAIGASMRGGRILKWTKILFLLPLITPDVSLGLAVGHAALTLGIDPSLKLVAFAHSIFGSAIVFFVVQAAFDRNAHDVIESALALGIRRFLVVAHVVWKTAKSALLAAAIVCFVVSLDDFAVSQFSRSSGDSTLPVALNAQLSKGIRNEHLAVAITLATFNAILVIGVLRKFGLNAFGLEELAHDKSSDD